jgi:hypothetical protein
VDGMIVACRARTCGRLSSRRSSVVTIRGRSSSAQGWTDDEFGNGMELHARTSRPAFGNQPMNTIWSGSDLLP